MPRRRPLDASALGEHIDRLMRAATAMCGDRVDAEDLVQETFARVLAKPRRLTREDELPYLLTSLRNVFLNDRRTRSRRPQIANVPFDAPSAAPGPERAMEVREVFAVIAALPAD